MTAAGPGGEPLRVLLVEDNPGDARLIEEQLAGSNFAVTSVETLAAARERLRGAAFDAVLVDLSLPDGDGLATFRTMRELTPEPVIVLTGHDDQETALRAVGEGAQDYLVKDDVTGELLRRALRYAVERTEAEARLARAQRFQTIGRLASGIAHDFNNMLTAIVGYSELLLEAPGLLEEHREYVREIRRTCRRSSYITQQLLAYSRRQIVRPALLDVNQVVRELRGTLVPLLGDGVDLRIDLDPAVGPVRADKGQLEQVVLNLVLNAGEAIEGEGRIDLRTEAVELDAPRAWSLGGLEAGPYVLLVVRDTGHGIAPRDLPHIFEPFYTTKPRTKGTGLGLATVDGIVHQSGGTVVVDPRPGEGAEFRVFLPQRTGALRPAEPASVPERQGEGTILLCEDEPTVRRLLALYLRKQGYRVLEAADGPEALAAAAREPIDLLVSDLVLPGRDGDDLAELFRRREPPVPVILMSGYLRAAGRRSDGTRVLQKPFPLDELLDAVRAELPPAGG